MPGDLVRDRVRSRIFGMVAVVALMALVARFTLGVGLFVFPPGDPVPSEVRPCARLARPRAHTHTGAGDGRRGLNGGSSDTN